MDGTGDEVLEGATLLMENGLISCVGECEVPSNAVVHDADNKYIIPGLIDTHVHYSGGGWGDTFPGLVDADLSEDYPYDEMLKDLKEHPEKFHQSYLCSGVTAVFDAGGYPWTMDIRDSANRSLAAPHMAAAGPLLTTIEGLIIQDPLAKDFSVYMDDPENVRSAVRRVAEMNTDAVKLHALSQEEGKDWLEANLKAAADEAQKLGLPLIANPNGNVLSSAKMALKYGAKLFVYPIEDTLMDQEFIDLALGNDLVYPSALAIPEGFAEFTARDFREEQIDLSCIDPYTLNKAFMTDSLEKAEDSAINSSEVVPKGDPEVNKMRIANLKRAHAAGIKIAIGSSAGVPLSLHGQATIYEMEQLQEAGFTPRDILVFATANGAQGMFRDDLGMLKPGYVADMVILNKNPLEDISHVRSVDQVVRGGKVWSRKALEFNHEE